MANNVPAPADSKALTLKDHLSTIKDTLVKTKQNLLDLLPATLRSEDTIRRFLEGVQFSVWKNPELAVCDRPSLIAAVIYCVRMGLEPGAEDGCALVPFSQRGKTQKVVTPIPQYKGLIKRATETKSVTSVDTRLVYENDFFEWEEGTNAHITHKPTKLGQPRGKIIGCYAIYTMPDGTKKHFVMDEEDVIRIRNMAAAYKNNPDGGPWHDHFWAMGQKTAIRGGFKTIPVNQELRKLLDTDARLEGGESLTSVIQEITLDTDTDLPEGTLPEEPPTQAERIAGAIRISPEPEPEQTPGGESESAGGPPENVQGNEPPGEELPPLSKAAKEAIGKMENGPLLNPEGFAERVKALMYKILSARTTWMDIKKATGVGAKEEINATNIDAVEAFIEKKATASAGKKK